MTDLSRFFLVAVLALVLSSPALAQTQYDARPGIFVSGDVYGAQNRFTAELKSLGFSFGFRVAGTESVPPLDFALRVERLDGYLIGDGATAPPETLLGIEVGGTLRQRARSVTRAALSTGALFAVDTRLDDRPEDGFRFRRRSVFTAVTSHAGVTRYWRVGLGPVAAMPGLGAYAEGEWRFGRDVVFDPGGEDEREVRWDGFTNATGGVLLTLPVMVEPLEGRLIVVEPILKVDVPELIFGAWPIVGYVNVRLNL